MEVKTKKSTIRLNRQDKLALTGALCLLVSFSGGTSKAAEDQKAVDPAAMIAAHNQWRSKTGVPGLKWSAELAEAAHEWAAHLAESTCTPGHSNGKYGENVYMASPVTSSDGSTKMQDITVQNVVDAWGNEIKDYDHEDNTCHFVCGHYTQVVWKTTTEVGCGMATCEDNSQIWICQYTPAGNMVGEKPY